VNRKCEGRGVGAEYVDGNNRKSRRLPLGIARGRVLPVPLADGIERRLSSILKISESEAVGDVGLVECIEEFTDEVNEVNGRLSLSKSRDLWRVRDIPNDGGVNICCVGNDPTLVCSDNRLSDGLL